MKFFITIRAIAHNFALAVDRFVTFDHLAESIREHTEASNALSNALSATIREHTVALNNHSVALLTKAATIDSIAISAKYLEDSERRGLQRSGQPHQF